MARHTPTVPEIRSVESIADSADLRSVLCAALATHPVDGAALRRGVWNYVGSERDAGVLPGPVILALTNVIEEADLNSRAERMAITRRVILWCVEAYFGHLGGAAVGSENGAPETGAVRVR